jgi:hypothetical protein
LHMLQPRELHEGEELPAFSRFPVLIASP